MPASRAAIVADTGALYALADADDVWHARVLEWWRQAPRHVTVPVVVLSEVTYLLAARLGLEAEQAFVHSLVDGELAIEQLESVDVARAATLLQQYADLPLGFVDAAVIATAERLGTREVLTTDRRHFGVVRPAHAPSLLLRP